MTAWNGDPLQLCSMYFQLDATRADIDQRIVRLPPDAPERDVLWQELETSLAELGDVIGRLARVQATDASQLSAKAAVLAKLLHSRDADGIPIIPDDKSTALALSLADEVVRVLS